MLDYAAREFGVDPTQYRITQGKDGGDRIEVRGRRLSVGDFLTREVKLAWAQARDILTRLGQQQEAERSGPSAQRVRTDRSLWAAYLDDHRRRLGDRDRVWREQRVSETSRRKAAAEQFRAARAEIIDSRDLPADKAVRLRLLRAARAVEQAAFPKAVAAERQALREQYPSYPSRLAFQRWLRGEAERGSALALGELRRLGLQLEALEAGAVGRLETPRGVDAILQSAGLTYRVDRHGAVSYYRDGERLMVDVSRHVDVYQLSEDALELSMRLAALKSGPVLTIEGDGDFLDLTVRVAIERRVNISFRDGQLEARRLSGIEAVHHRYVPRGPERTQ